jgi:hypothetical protein
MDWGAQAGRDYSGWLTVANHTEGASELVLHLSFGERCAGSEMREQAPERQSTPWRRHNGDAWEHQAAERGGFGQGGGPAACGGGPSRSWRRTQPWSTKTPRQILCAGKTAVGSVHPSARKGSSPKS